MLIGAGDATSEQRAIRSWSATNGDRSAPSQVAERARAAAVHTLDAPSRGARKPRDARSSSDTVAVLAPKTTLSPTNSRKPRASPRPAARTRHSVSEYTEIVHGSMDQTEAALLS